VILSRDRMYAITLAMTMVAIAAFGVFIYRDYQDQGQVHAALAGGPVTSAPGTAADQGNAPLATPGAGGAPAAAAPAGGTTVSSSGGSSVSGGGGAASSGGSSSGGSAAPVSVAGGNTQACQGGAINIGQIVPITGPVTEQTAANAVAAYFKQVNASGGINGCSVNFTYLDDGGLNQPQAAADARKLVQEDHVFAIVGNVEPVTTASTEPYFAQQGVPVVGAEGVGINEYNSPVEYSFAESPAGFGISTANFAKTKSCMKLAVFYLDFDFGHVSFDALQQQATKNGQTVVYSNNENVSSNSYGIDTRQAQSAGPDCVINIMDANSVVREFNAMNSNGWFPMIVGTTSTSDPVVNQSEAAWLSNPAHIVYVQRNYQPANANIPEVQEWMTTEGQYFPGFDPNSYAEGAWLGAKTFTDVARKLGGNLTRNALLTALNALHGYHNGFTPDVNMTSDHGPNKQVLWLKWNAGSKAYDPITGFQPW
jgi:branched-chain amino acid transport system substrate-binding protein